METNTNQKPSKAKQGNVSTVPLRVKRETKRQIQTMLTKINKKAFGRKVRVDALVSRALGLLTDADFKVLQDESLSNSDRLEQQYREYAKAHPGISKDEFLGKLLAENTGKLFGAEATKFASN